MILITIEEGPIGAAKLTRVGRMPMKAYSAIKNGVDRELYKCFFFTK